MLTMMHRRYRPGSPRTGGRGVSLIEALVALAVMAFGILGVVGVQTTLRSNGDIAKQRAEAVRIAQQEVDHWRSFTVLTLPPSPTLHTIAYDQLTSAGPTSVVGNNTTFALTRTVTASTSGSGKSVQVDVSWVDRGGTTQSVSLKTLVAGILPEISGSASIVPRSLSNSQLGGRNTTVPSAAVNQHDGTSNFSPTGVSGSIVWVFNNTTGLITSICNPFPTTCTGTSAALLAGFVRFSLGATQPLPQDAEAPVDAPVGGVQVLVNATAPAVSTVTCVQQAFASYIAYYCAVPLASTPPVVWSGRSVLDNSTLAIAATAGTSASQYRVCRYTPDATVDTAANADHPLDYANVSTSLINQNFLVIRAGNGSTAFQCPLDDSSTPDFDGDTRAHQPPN